jgi:HD-like signal output (HDOD) protein
MKEQDYAHRADDIFVLPEAVTKIKQLIDDQSASIDDIANVINFDPGIMSQVLKISNSALYRFPQAINTVTKAIQLIGTQSVYDLVLAYGVANAFKTIDSDVIDLDKFWRQSICCGLLARNFAEHLGLKEPEKLFVCGLLHNLGELVLVKLNPNMAKRCANNDAKNRPLSVQQQNLGFTYAQVSAALLGLWGIPTDISQIILHTHKETEHSAELEHQLMQLSYLLAMNNIDSEYYAKYQDINLEYYQDIGLNQVAMDNALDESNLQLMGAMALFSPTAFNLF